MPKYSALLQQLLQLYLNFCGTHPQFGQRC